MIDVSIKIVATKKSGTLSRIIREIKLFGLDYKSHKIEYARDRCFIAIESSGELNCTRETLIEHFECLTEVIGVDRLTVSRNGEELQEFRTTVSEAHIGADETLSPAILLSAEKRMSEILGPVSSFLVEKAASNSRNVGDLYRLLAEELDDPEEREKFLAVIEK